MDLTNALALLTLLGVILLIAILVGVVMIYGTLRNIQRHIDTL